MANKVANFRWIWFQVPQKFLWKHFYSQKRIDEKTRYRLCYYRGVLERIANKVQHLISIIDTINLR